MDKMQIIFAGGTSKRSQGANIRKRNNIEEFEEPTDGSLRTVSCPCFITSLLDFPAVNPFILSDDVAIAAAYPLSLKHHQACWQESYPPYESPSTRKAAMAPRNNTWHCEKSYNLKSASHCHLRGTSTSAL
jgi:hypothetical protein